MPKRTFSLSIKGDLPLAELAAAFASFSDLVTAIARDVAPQAEIAWIVDDLDVGSLDIAAHAESTDERALERVDAEYLAVGRFIERRNGAHFAVPVEDAASGFSDLLADSVVAMRFETPSGRVTVGDYAQWPDEAPDLLPTESLGSVEGVIQTVTSRGGLRFTVYDVLYDRAVRCYLSEGEEELMRDVWERLAQVSGIVTRDGETGRPIAIQSITDARSIDDAQAGSYQESRGVLKRGENVLRAEAVIRRMRDAD